MSELSPTLKLVVSANDEGLKDLIAALGALKGETGKASEAYASLNSSLRLENARHLNTLEQQKQNHEQVMIELTAKANEKALSAAKTNSTALARVAEADSELMKAVKVRATEMQEQLNAESLALDWAHNNKKSLAYTAMYESALLENQVFNKKKLAAEESMYAEAIAMDYAFNNKRNDAYSAMRAQALAMDYAFNAKKLAAEESMYVDAIAMNYAFDIKKIAQHEVMLVKQAEQDVAYGQMELARQIKLRKEIEAAQAHPNLGTAYVAQTFAPAAVADARPIAVMEEALIKQGIAAKAAASGHAELNAMMREGHSLARGLAGPLNAMWLTWGSLAPLLAGAAISSAIVGSIKAGSDFEMVLSRIQGVSGETAAAVDHAGERFKQLAQNSIFSASDVATGSQILVQAGLSLTEATKSLPTVMQLAAVGELNMSNAAEIATGTMNAFGLSINAIPAIANVLSKAADISQTNIGEMGEAMKQASTVAKEYQVDLVDMSAGIATLAQVNIRGSAAGTAFKNMLTNLVAPTEKGAKELAKLGVSAFDADGQMKDLPDTFKRLSDALKDLNEADSAAAINSIFSERGAKGAINYMNALDSGKINEFTNALKGVADTQDYLTKKQDLLNDTVGAQGKMAFNALGVAMIEAFDASETGLMELTKSLKEFLLSDSFKQGLKDVVSGFVSLVNAIKEALPLIGSLLAGLATSKFAFAAAGALELAAGIGAAGAAASLLTLALGPVGLAIAAAAAVWYLFRDKAVESLDIVDGRISKSIDLMRKLADENYRSTKVDVASSNQAVQNANEELRQAKAAQQKLTSGGSADTGNTYAQQLEINKARINKASTEVEVAQKNAQTLANKLYEENTARAEAADAVTAKTTSTASTDYKAPAKVDKAVEAETARKNAAENAANQEAYNSKLKFAKQLETSEVASAKLLLDNHKISLAEYNEVTNNSYTEYASTVLTAEQDLNSKLLTSEKTGRAVSDAMKLANKKKQLEDDRQFNVQVLKDTAAFNDAKSKLAIESYELSAAANLKKLDTEAAINAANTQDKFDRRYDKPVDNAGADARVKAEKAYQTEINKTQQLLDAIEAGYGTNTAAAQADEQANAYRKYIENIQKAKTAQGDLAESAAEANQKISESWQDGAMKAVFEYTKATENAAQTTYKLMNKLFSGLTDNITAFVKTGKLDFKSLASSMIEDLIRIQVQEMATKSFGMLGDVMGMSGFGGMGGGSTGEAFAGAGAGSAESSGFMSAVSSMFGFRNGGAFDAGVQKFASGGAFTNQVVNSPTNFPMGQMGEAGPEAIMPLSRDSSGRLGVKSSGSSSGASSITNIVQITVQGGDDAGKTGDIISEKVIQTMKNIADGQIANSKRLGGAFNPVHD